ncbi:cell wall hydrolase [Pseudorhodoplanes sp.]|uniref:cell wall hydrolase n=1 Tax=Pseudorhodoplanes sp. TaxID=1934341 RepID=UPI002B7151A9|nr:cell wall hydrolase [Pseudorhodoplanes sp.]HWV43507.1 cell wall hydrolase [Pseudorhodoplanes sp.]
MRRGFASLCLACATIIVAIFLGTPAKAYQAPADEEKITLADPINRSRDIAYETDLYCLALAVYFEGGSTDETEEGQRHIAHVIVARAKANRQIWGGNKICDVVFYKRAKVCQFSFACLPLEKRTVRGGKAWRYSMDIARDEIEGRSGLEDRLLRYYMNASLTPPKNACRFRKEFVPVVQAGRHEFFREATRAERRELEKAEHAECLKYEASLKKKKDARKRKGKTDARLADAKPGTEGKSAKTANANKTASANKPAKAKNDVATAARKQPPRKLNVAKR